MIETKKPLEKAILVGIIYTRDRMKVKLTNSLRNSHSSLKPLGQCRLKGSYRNWMYQIRGHL